MNSCWSRIVEVFSVFLMFIAATRGSPALAESEDRSSWRLQRKNQAVERACTVIGVKRTSYRNAGASVITLKDDNTPYLSDQLTRRPLWHVVLRGWAFELKHYPAGYEDLYSRTADIYLDPITKSILKVKTRWPEGAPEMPPEVSAETGAAQMLQSGAWRYHGFPAKEPDITFLDALDSIWRFARDSPMGAKQVVGHYVMWSRMGRQPRAVWAVMLRGVPVKKPPPGTPVDAMDQYTYIIDATSGNWIATSNRPSPAKAAE